MKQTPLKIKFYWGSLLWHFLIRGHLGVLRGYLSPQFEKNADLALKPKRFEILIFAA